MSSSSSSSISTSIDDSQLTLTGMGTQLGINVAISVVVLCAFNFLRPNNSLVYAPRYKYSSKTKQPPAVGRGFFDWLKPVMHTPDDVLIEKIGFDATLYIQFIRLIRRILYTMTFVGVCIIIPINIAATSFTGEWPPSPGVEFLSIATINYYDGKFHSVNGNLLWYWCHAGSTWVFSTIVYVFLWRFYSSYTGFRQKYFESEDYQKSMHGRTLMIYNVPQSLRSDDALGAWVNKLGLKYPPQQVCIGTQNRELAKYVEEHEQAVRILEIILSNHLKDGKLIRDKKRPLIRVGGFMGCCGGKKVDAINYYSEAVQELQNKITDARARITCSKKTNYGWILFDKVAWAHANAKYLASKSSPLTSLSEMFEGPTPSIELAPQPKDIIWSNLSMNEHVKRTKRLLINCIFYAFVFFWFIPSSFLSASNNVKNFLKLFPNSTKFMKANPTFVSLFSAWFTPIIMAIFFFILPKVLRFMSQQQGYTTGTSLDRQVLAKLFIFFIINNFLVFTVSSTLISIYTEIQQAVTTGQTLTTQDFVLTMKNNLTQVAKNLIDVSTYWVNYVSLKSLGIIMDLAQVTVLFTVTLRKWFTKPSPRQLQEFTRPSSFDYPLFYNALLFFFTVGLVYSVIAPLVLPFTLVYFLITTIVFKYLLMYIFVTNVETGGQIWRLLFNRLLVSTVMFQLLMVAVLTLKSAKKESMAVAPLPVVTIVFKIICHRRFDSKVYYYAPKFEGPGPLLHNKDQKDVGNQHGKGSVGVRFGDPAFFAELPIPMIHEHVRHLLPKLYHTNITDTLKKPFVSRMTRQKSVRQVSVVHMQNEAGQKTDLQFQSVGDKDIELDDSEEGLKGMYKFNEDDERENYVEPTRTDYYHSHTSGSLIDPIRRFSNRISSSLQYHRNNHTHQRNDMYSPRKPLVSSASFVENDSIRDERDNADRTEYYTHSNTPQKKEDMEYFVAGRAYKTHNPRDLDDSNLIELADLYRSQQTPYVSEEHRNVFADKYDRYVRSPISVHTTGNGKYRNHADHHDDHNQHRYN